MRYQELPYDDHVCRQIGLRSLITDGDDRVIGISYTGLQDTRQPEDDDGLSVTWIEFFAGAWEERMRLAFQAMCTTRKPPKRGVLAWANVGRVIEEATKGGHRIRILHDPVEGNPAHSLIKKLPQDDIELLDRLASDVFGDFVLIATLL